MAEVKLPKEIASLSGRMGDYVFRTRNGKTFMYYMPKKKAGRASKDVISR